MFALYDRLVDVKQDVSRRDYGLTSRAGRQHYQDHADSQRGEPGVQPQPPRYEQGQYGQGPTDDKHFYLLVTHTVFQRLS